MRGLLVWLLFCVELQRGSSKWGSLVIGLVEQAVTLHALMLKCIKHSGRYALALLGMVAALVCMTRLMGIGASDNLVRRHMMTSQVQTVTVLSICTY